MDDNNGEKQWWEVSEVLRVPTDEEIATAKEGAQDRPIVGRLFLEDGGVAGIYDIAEYWCHAYPEDIFVTEPAPVIRVREGMKEILALRTVRR